MLAIFELRVLTITLGGFMKSLLSLALVAGLLTFATVSFSATEPVTQTTPYGFGEDKVQKLTWQNLQGGDIGAAVKAANWTIKSVSVSGTFTGVSGTIQGSNDGVNYFDLTEAGISPASVITFTANGLKQIRENTLFIRPNANGGVSGTLQFDVIMAK